MKPLLNSKMRYELRCELYNNQYTKYTPKEYQLLGDAAYCILSMYTLFYRSDKIDEFYYVLGVEYGDLIYSLGVILNYFGIGIIDIEIDEKGESIITCFRKESRIWDLKTELS